MSFEFPTEYVIDLFCIAIILTLGIAILVQRKAIDKSARRFLGLLATVIVYLGLNFSCELFEGRTDLYVWLVHINLFAYFSIDLVIIAFTLYIDSILEGAKVKARKLLTANIIICCARVLLIVVLEMTGHLFSLVDGYYYEGDLEFLPYIISVLSILLMISYVIINRSCFTTREVTVIVIYLFLPILPVFVEMKTNMYYLSSIAMTLSSLIIYVLIQALDIEKGIIRQSVLEEISNTDQLTGLNNRRAYYDRINALSPDKSVGVMFCDINGLKYTNDNFGHKSGDNLIVRFATLLSDNFRGDETYRISGDEFVVIMPSVTQDVFSQRVDKFGIQLKNNDNIAAMGCAFGNGCAVQRLISEAEAKMYENKRLCSNSRYSADAVKAPR